MTDNKLRITVNISRAVFELKSHIKQQAKPHAAMLFAPLPSNTKDKTVPTEPFTSAYFKHPIDNERVAVFNAVWQRLGEPGYWWNAEEKSAIAQACRDAKPRAVFERTPTDITTISNSKNNETLSPLCRHVVDKICTEPGDISPAWAKHAIATLGEGAYAEIIAIIILLMPIDLLCTYTETALMPLPSPQAGEPSRCYPENLRDNGAWIRQSSEAINNPELVNVSRAISILPKDNELRRALVDAMYMEGHSFFDTHWERKAVPRYLLEIVATRTSAINECFYCATGHTAIFNIVAKAENTNADLSLLIDNNHTDNTAIDLLLQVTESANRDRHITQEHSAALLKQFNAQGLTEIYSTIAIFNGLNRTSDPSGVPLEDVLLAAMGNKIDQLGLQQFAGHARVKRPGLFRRLLILLSFKLRRLLGAGQ